MLPTVIIGTLHISTYWTMYVLGGFSMGYLLTRHRDRYSLSVSKALLFTLLLALCGLTGAKLLCFWKRLRMGRRILLRLCIPDPAADGAAGPAVRAAPGAEP